MVKSIVVGLLGIACGIATAGTAGGQVEVGGGAGSAFAISGEAAEPTLLLDARITAPINERFAIEGAFDPLLGTHGSTSALYGMQVKQRVMRKSSSTLELFVTYGGWGSFNHYSEQHYEFVTAQGVRRTYDIPAHTRFYPSGPLLPVVGIGVRRILGSHAAVRFDVQAFAALPYPFAVTRATAGVSVPLGRYSIHSAGRRDVIQ